MIGGVRTRWLALARRERIAIASGAVLTMGALVYAVGIEPAWQTRARLLRELPRLQSELADLEALREQARGLKQQGYGAEERGSLQAAAQRSLGRDGIAGEVRAEGERGIAVRAAGVPAQAWFAWVEGFARESRVRVLQMHVARGALAGMVDAEASLEAPARW